jgi:hypothetical protein
MTLLGTVTVPEDTESRDAATSDEDIASSDEDTEVMMLFYKRGDGGNDDRQ